MKIRYFKVICGYIFVIDTVFFSSVFGYNSEKRNVKLYDLPLKSDLPVYLKSLRRIIEFFNIHANDVDINVMFGLFLVNVNLKRAWKSNNELTEPLKHYLNEIISENDSVLNYFKFKVETDFNRRDLMDKMIVTLFSNETAWFIRLPRIVSPSINNVSHRRTVPIVMLDSSWKKYRTNVDNFDRWVPNPKHSDTCMASLAENSVSNYDTYFKCRVPQKCIDMLINGTDFGYALNHRLLFLLNARYGRGCSVFSPKKDKSLTKKFCSLAYIESEYISGHNYEIVDLILEQVCLCALDGHAEFLRRSWLENILRFQTEHGCYGEHLQRAIYIERFEQNIWKLSKQDHELLGGECNGHVTAGAAATLSAAVRFIIENYD